MRVAFLARFSSRMQDQNSIEAQIAEMHKFSDAHGWTNVAIYELPETRSADIEASKEFQAMMASAKRKEFDILLLHRLDRLGRDRRYAILHKAALRKIGIQVRSVVENLDDDDAMDRAMEGFFEVMAEWGAANIGIETKKGHKQLVRKGCWTGGTVPWGLSVEATADGHKRLLPDPHKAPVIRTVFEMVAAGQRTGDVLDYVEEATGERWSHPSFYARIRASVYAGHLAYGLTSMPAGRKRRKAEHKDEIERGSWGEGIVSQELWDKANDILNTRGKEQSMKRRPKAFYLLSDGCMICTRCDSPMIGGYCNEQRRYMCSARGRTCKYGSVRADVLEPTVRTLIGERLASIDLNEVMQAYEDTQAPRLKESQRQEAHLRKLLSKVREQIRNMVEAIANGMFFPEMKDKMEALKSEEASLAQDIATCQLEAEASVKLDVALVRQHVQTTLELLRCATDDEFKRLLRDLFRIEIDLDKQEGQLLFKLASDPEESRRFSFGRSARICTFPRIAGLCLRTHRVETVRADDCPLHSHSSLRT